MQRSDFDFDVITGPPAGQPRPAPPLPPASLDPPPPRPENPPA